MGQLYIQQISVSLIMKIRKIIKIKLEKRVPLIRISNEFLKLYFTIYSNKKSKFR